MTEQECKSVNGGYQESPQDHAENRWHEVVHYFCTIVSQTYIEIEYS